MTEQSPRTLPTQTTPAGDASGRTSRSQWRWSPPRLAAAIRVKRWADRLLPRAGMPAVLVFLTVIALLSFTGVAVGRSLAAGAEGWSFDAVLALGILFEITWRQVHGNTAVTREARAG